MPADTERELVYCCAACGAQDTRVVYDIESLPTLHGDLFDWAKHEGQQPTTPPSVRIHAQDCAWARLPFFVEHTGCLQSGVMHLVAIRRTQPERRR